LSFSVIFIIVFNRIGESADFGALDSKFTTEPIEEFSVVGIAIAKEERKKRIRETTIVKKKDILVSLLKRFNYLVFFLFMHEVEIFWKVEFYVLL
jgi:hypothetical protein